MLDHGVLKAISDYAGGDARVALNTLEHLLLAKNLGHHEMNTGSSSDNTGMCRISVKDIKEGICWCLIFMIPRIFLKIRKNVYIRVCILERI